MKPQGREPLDTYIVRLQHHRVRSDLFGPRNGVYPDIDPIIGQFDYDRDFTRAFYRSAVAEQRSRNVWRDLIELHAGVGHSMETVEERIARTGSAVKSPSPQLPPWFTTRYNDGRKSA